MAAWRRRWGKLCSKTPTTTRLDSSSADHSPTTPFLMQTRCPRSARCVRRRPRRVTRSVPRVWERRARSGLPRLWSMPSSMPSLPCACGTWTCLSHRRRSGRPRGRDVPPRSAGLLVGSVMTPEPSTAFLVDLDGTLVDSVYQHVLAWREALEAAGIQLAVWRIHRRIGMSGGLFVHALLRETGHRVTAEEAQRLQPYHAAAYARQMGQVRPLPGARELLAYLSRQGVPWTIATSGRAEGARPALQMLGVGPEVPMITRDLVEHAKPDPDLFLAAAERLGVDIRGSVVVGDSVWDLLAS